MSASPGKRFALIGAAGFVAPRHMQAISRTGNVLVAAMDPADSVGVLDSWFPETEYFVEYERFDRHLYKLHRRGEGVDYVSVCSPNWLHDAHVRFALRSSADAICEKPLVLNPWNIDGLIEMEQDTGRRVHTILQLRIHPSAIVDAGATIGAGCSLGQNVYVGNRVTIGDNVRIQNNVSVYDNVTLEDDVFCGPSLVFTNVSNPRSAVSRKDEYRDTLVRRGATLGANATIVCGVEIGHHAFVGAGAVVTRDVAAHALVIGVPARHVGWMCEAGHRLELPLASDVPVEASSAGVTYRLSEGRVERAGEARA